MLRIGKPFVKRGKVVAYVYRYGKRTSRDLVRIHQLTPSDLRKGVKPAIVAAALLQTLRYLGKAAFEP